MLTRSRLLGVALAGAMLLALPACNDDTAGRASDDPASGPTVVDAWAQLSSDVELGAVYLTLQGGSEDDTLTGVSVEPSVAAGSRLSEMVADDAATTTMPGAGDMQMEVQEIETLPVIPPGSIARDLASLPVPAGEIVAMTRGGRFVLLRGLTAPLTEGRTFDVTLRLTKAGTKKATVDVRVAQ